MQTLVRLTEIAVALGVVGLVVRELERSERKELLHQVTQLARKKAGREWLGLLSRCVKRIRRAVSRWAWRTAKRKELKAMREYRALTKVYNEAGK